MWFVEHALQSAPCWGISFELIQHLLCIYSIMSVLNHCLSPITISAHYQGFSGELQRNKFPEMEFCSHEYMPSFYEFKRE